MQTENNFERRKRVTMAQMRNDLAKVWGRVIAVVFGTVAVIAWVSPSLGECPEGSCPTRVQKSFIAGRITWSHSEETGCLEPSVSDGEEVCGWEDPCQGCQELPGDEVLPVFYELVEDVIVEPDPDDPGTWYRRVTFIGESNCGGGQSVLTSTSDDICLCTG